MQKPFFSLLLFGLFLACQLTLAQQSTEGISRLIFQKTNALRSAKGLPALKALDSLTFLAQYHSNNMATKAFYSHIDSEGLNPVTRAEKLGIQPWRKTGNRYSGIAENIARVPWFDNVIGCGDTRSTEALAECMVEGWKKSPPHYKNILGDYLYLGVGIQFDAMGMGFGTQVFR